MESHRNECGMCVRHTVICSEHFDLSDYTDMYLMQNKVMNGYPKKEMGEKNECCTHFKSVVP